MRKLAILGSLVLSLALITPASAASDASWKATLAQAGISGTVTVSITSTTVGTVVLNLKGLAPRTLSVLWLRGGKCSSTAFPAVRVRWWVPASGRLAVTLTIPPAMIGYFTFDMTHRGGIHATMASGSATACGQMSAVH